MGSDGKDKIQKNKFNGKTAEPPLSAHSGKLFRFQKVMQYSPGYISASGEPFSIYSITQMETRFVCHSLPTLK